MEKPNLNLEDMLFCLVPLCSHYNQPWEDYLPERYKNYLFKIDRVIEHPVEKAILELSSIPDPSLEEIDLATNTRPKLVISYQQLFKYFEAVDLQIIRHNHPLTNMFTFK